MVSDSDYRARIESLLASLHVSGEFLAARALTLFSEAETLAIAEIGRNGREHLLIPAAADSWRAMRAAARADEVELAIVSAFRGVDRQAEIVREKLARGITMEEVFAVSAPPGYSEHHSGCAVDVTTAGVPPLDAAFEQTAAFSWLLENAGSFSYFLSFPRGNRHGYAFEPWHWCYRRKIA